MTDQDNTSTTEVQPGPEPAKGPRRLLRSADDRVLAGVAGGLGRYFDIDPVIVRIAFAVSVLFGGLGIVAYIAAAIFVPADDGTGNPAPSSRAQGAGKVLLAAALAIAALFGFGALAAAAAFVTGLGYGLIVALAIVAIGLLLIALSFRGAAKWLIVPALALSIGVAAAAAADLDLEGGVGEREYRPLSASAIPADGYELGVGRLAIDLREIDWSRDRVLDLDARLGLGEMVVAVPSDVCVVANVSASGGDLRVAGERSDGVDPEVNTAAGSRATPQLMLDADLDFGAVRVVNDDDYDIADHGRRFGPFDENVNDYAGSREANARACAG